MKFVKHINILDGPFVHSSTSSPTPCSERVYLDPSKYSGACTVYTEIVYTNTSASGPALSWTGIGSNGVNGITLSGNVSTPTLVRSSAGTLTSSANEGFFSVSALGSAGTLTIKSARLVIIQDTGTDPLIATESQFEIGNRETGKTNTSSAPLAATKYYKEESANWDGSRTAYAEVVWEKSGTMYSQTFTLQKSTDFATWTDVVTIVNASSASALTRSRSASFTLEDGNYYRLAGFISNSMENYSVYCAKIIIEQFEGGYETSDSGTQGLGGNSSQEAVAQSFQITKADSITGVRLKLKKTGSPTDNLTVQLVSTLGGTVLASGSISGSSLTTSLALYDITFGSPYSPTINTTYYLQVVRSGSLDSSNLYAWQLHTSGAYSLGGNAVRASGAWGSVTPSFDSYFILLGSTGVTKTVSEALAANTTLAAGTSLQNFLVKYDPAEYDGVDVDFIHQVDASDNNTSVVEIDTAAGSQIAGSVAALPDNVGSHSNHYPFSNSSTETNIYSGGNQMIGQSFVGKGSTLLSALFRISKVGSPTGNVYAKIYAHTGTFGSTGLPTGSVLATSDALDISTLTTTLTIKEFSFSGSNKITLTDGTNYFLVLEYSAGNSSNYLLISVDNTSPTDAGNMAQSINGSSWNVASGIDIVFAIQYSMTMPGSSGNLDVKATTNSGSVYASKIIAKISKTAAVLIPRSWGAIIGA